MLLTYHDYQALRQVQFEASRLLHNWLVRKGAEDEHEGKKGKWRTVNGRRIFLEDGKEDEQLKEHVESFKDSPKKKLDKVEKKLDEIEEKTKDKPKLPKFLQQSYKEYDYPDFEKTWQEKYAKKWDAVLKKGDWTTYKALVAIPLVGRNRWGYKDGSERYLYDNFKDKDWVEARLDKLNELFGEEKTIEDLFGEEVRNPTEEEKIAFAKRANELEDLAIVKEKEKYEMVKKAEGEDSNWAKNIKERIEKMPGQKKTWTPEDFNSMVKAYRNGEYLKDIEDGLTSHGRDGESTFTWGVLDKFEQKYPVYNIKSEIQENPMKFYDLLKDEPGPLGDAMRRQAEVEAVNRKIRQQATSIWRGGDGVELNNFLEEGFIGAGRKKKESDMPAKTHGRVPVSYYKRGAGLFDNGVMFEYDKEELGEENVHPEFYNMFVDIDYGPKKMYWNDYTPNGHDPRLKMQAEGAIQSKNKLKPKKLKIHVDPKGYDFIEEFGEDHVKPDVEHLKKKITEKYGHLGEIVWQTPRGRMKY